jgi:hypothetical protein
MIEHIICKLKYITSVLNEVCMCLCVFVCACVSMFVCVCPCMSVLVCVSENYKKNCLDVSSTGSSFPFPTTMDTHILIPHRPYGDGDSNWI